MNLNPDSCDVTRYAATRATVRDLFSDGDSLFELNLGTSLFELLLEALGISLGNAFLDNRGCAVNHLLSLLKAKTCEFLNELHNSELACAGCLEHYVK